MLIAGLVVALFGSSLIGILDPIALTVRSLALSVFPAMNYGLEAVLGGLHHSPVSLLRNAGYVAQLIFNETLLSFRQPYFRQAFFLGAIFVSILVLNLRITRFWCRALCPLGALLGIVSRWSILGLEKHSGHLRRLQSLPAGLPGRGRSASPGEVAESGMPPLLQLRGRMSGNRNPLQVLSRDAHHY